MSSMKKSFAVLALGLGAVVVGSTGAAADGFYRESLRDLPGVYVVVETPNEVAKAAGLDTGIVRLRVERYLTLRGIPVLTREKMLAEKSAPKLHVQISAGGRDQILWVADMVLYQNVTTLASDAAVPAGTWIALTGFGMNSPKRLKSSVWSCLESQLDSFAQDWNAANEIHASDSAE